MKALDGIRVLDFSTHTAGPTCTAMMADLGAEVIKVEMPKVGDDTRYLANAVEGYSTQFMWNNRGKKSITVNMKDPEGVAALLELGKKVDVVLETMKPGSMKKMGLDYEAFKAVALSPRSVRRAPKPRTPVMTFWHRPAAASWT